MSGIKLRAKLEPYLEDNDFCFDIDSSKHLCIRKLCGRKIVVFYNLTFEKKEPTELEIEFAEKKISKVIHNINIDLQKLKKLEKIEVEPINVTRCWNDGDCYKITEGNLYVEFNMPIKQIKEIKITVNSIKQLDKERVKIDNLIETAIKYIELELEKENILSRLDQNCHF